MKYCTQEMPKTLSISNNCVCIYLLMQSGKIANIIIEYREQFYKLKVSNLSLYWCWHLISLLHYAFEDSMRQTYKTHTSI